MDIVSKFKEEIELFRILTRQAIDEGVNDKHIFKALFLGGAGGSGKGEIGKLLTLRDDLFGGNEHKLAVGAISALGVKKIDPDTFFERLLIHEKELGGIENIFKKQLPLVMEPEKSEVGTMQQAVRKHAKHRTQTHLDTIIDGMLPILIDTTAKDVEDIVSYKKKLEDAGYDTGLILVSVPLDVCLARNASRPRQVDPEIIKDTWHKIEANKKSGVYSKLFGNDFIEIDNSDKTGEEKDNFQKNVRKIGTRFFSSPLKNPIGIKTLENLRKLGLKDLRDLKNLPI